MPILTTEQIRKISRAGEDAKTHHSTYAKHLTNILFQAAEKANLFEKFYGLVFRGQEPIMILTTLNRNEIWRGHPIQTAVVFDTCGVLDDVQERCGESIFISWDFDENSSDIINVFVTFVPPKKPIYNPEDEDDEDREERRHEHDTSW